ncbi:hypothetical protein DL93DRAFT_1976251 [Clavulina sp. PMI_390]|nr:hypothetical protein DL93DRAFT_1976251 [Clavulina sp. PMI_390]
MDRLPIELISHVFTLGCDFPSFYAFTRSQFHPPWSANPLAGIEGRDSYRDWFRVTITSVSRSWREIAYSTAELWSIIDIRLMGSSSDTPKAFVESCLKYSSTKPLDISLSGHEATRILAIWEAIAPALRRCRSLHLLVPSQAFHGMSPLPKDLDLLEEANFTAGGLVHDHLRGILSSDIFSTPSSLPRLRRLRFRDLEEGMLSSSPLENLHDFTFESNIILKPSILARLREVRHLVLNCRFPREAGFKPLELPNLRTIELHNDLVVNLITAPKLLRLAAQGMGFSRMLKPETFPNVREVELQHSTLAIWPLYGFQDAPRHQLMPSVEIFRLPLQDLNSWRISVSMLLDPNTAGTDAGVPHHPPVKFFPSLRILYCKEVSSTTFLGPDEAHFNTVRQYLDGLLIQLLRQRPLLSVVVTDAIMTPGRMEVLAPELRERVANSDAELETSVRSCRIGGAGKALADDLER